MIDNVSPNTTIMEALVLDRHYEGSQVAIVHLLSAGFEEFTTYYRVTQLLIGLSTRWQYC